MNRRSFLGTLTAATLLTRRLGWSAEGGRKLDAIGVQLYTVRGEMKRDFEGTLAKVAAIGYREVEFAGYFEHSPKEVRAILDRHGLAAPSAHVEFKTLGVDWPKVLDAAHVVGHHYIVCPWVDVEVRNAPDGWKHAAEVFNRAAEASKRAGVQFAYHNHNFEFQTVNGKLPYDILLAETDRDLVKMEMDLYWITLAGQDPLAYFDKHPGRFPLVHVKDRDKNHNAVAVDSSALDSQQVSAAMVDVGSGVVDFKRIFAQSGKGGIKHYFVEHDQPKAPFESIRNSFNYLHELRF